MNGKNHQYNAQEFKITHKLSPLSAKIFLGFCVIGGYRPSGEGQPSTVYGDTLICIVHLFVIIFNRLFICKFCFRGILCQTVTSW